MPLPPPGLERGPDVRVEVGALGDGRTRFVLAVPEGMAARWPVLMLPDGRGLTHSYETLVALLARCGVLAAGVDLHGPVAGPDERPDDLVQQYSRELRWPVLRLDLVDAARALCERSGADGIVLLGFCLGARLALLAGGDADIPAREVIALYPDPVGPARGDVPAPIEHGAGLRCRVQLLIGGADELVPAEHVARYLRALRSVGTPVDAVRYPGAPHSFFDRGLVAEHRDACADVWHRVLATSAG